VTRVSGAARRAGGAARTYLHRDARGGAWTPGAGVDTGRASLGLTRRAAVRARHRARHFPILSPRPLRALRVNDLRCQGGTSGFHRYHAFVTIGFPHTRPRVDVVDGPRASARCEAMARYATRHADARTRARAHLCASPTSRRHDFYRRRRRIDGFASSITGASAFFSSSLDRAPSAPSVFARLGTHTPLPARLPTAVNGHDPAEPPSARRSTCCRRIAPRPRAGGKPPRRASARATPRMSSRSRAKPRGRCGRSYTPRSSKGETTCARWRSRSPP